MNCKICGKFMRLTDYEMAYKESKATYKCVCGGEQYKIYPRPESLFHRDAIALVQCGGY